MPDTGTPDRLMTGFWVPALAMRVHSAMTVHRAGPSTHLHLSTRLREIRESPLQPLEDRKSPSVSGDSACSLPLLHNPTLVREKSSCAMERACTTVSSSDSAFWRTRWMRVYGTSTISESISFPEPQISPWAPDSRRNIR